VALNQKYGTDAMRFCLASMAAPGTDIVLSDDRLASARNFANKIWNAARFLFMNLEKFERGGVSLEQLAAPEIRSKAPYAAASRVALIDGWLFARLASTIDLVNEALKNYRFHEAAQGVYQFFWGDFCDWYIEWIKPELASPDREIAVAAWRNIFAAFDAALRLLHPFMPFITEELWHKLPQNTDAKSIALDRFPQPRAELANGVAEAGVTLLQELITAARNIRAELKVDAKRKVAADFASQDAAVRKLADDNREMILRLAALSSLNISDGSLQGGAGAIRSTAQFDLRISHADAIDRQAEVARLRKERDRIEKDLAAKRDRLADSTFRNRAPAAIVKGLEVTLAERQLEYQKLLDRLAQLE
jgi:valyl-tRNA synthetase